MAQIAFLILAAMLLMNVVMLKFAEKYLVQNKMQTGRLIIHNLTRMICHEVENKNRSLQNFGENADFQSEVSKVLSLGKFTGALILNKAGQKLLTRGVWGKAEMSAMGLSRECLSLRKPSFVFFGSEWGILWLAPTQLNMCAPVMCNGRPLGVVTIGTSLEPLYQELRETEKIALIYIFLNALVLLIFGVYLISRSVVKPVQKLLVITEEYKDAGSVPEFSPSSPNEIGQLFQSFNKMLQQLEKNKKDLQENITSLEIANQEITRAQNDILRSEKLASVGRLATGVAHEIGNPIGIILGYLELLKGDWLSQTDKSDFLERMESEVTRINRTIRDLLDFSRTNRSEVKEVSVHEILLETLDMLAPQPMICHIRIETLLEAEQDRVWGDLNQLKQVFLNIIMNAADAMDETDTSGCVSSKTLTIKSMNKADFVELRFSDTGPGIPPENLIHIFDPFYTTKEPGKGTGLGLSVCYRILKGFGGDILAESEMGKGTAFVVRIPLYEGKVKREKLKV